MTDLDSGTAGAAKRSRVAATPPLRTGVPGAGRGVSPVSEPPFSTVSFPTAGRPGAFEPARALQMRAGADRAA